MGSLTGKRVMNNIKASTRMNAMKSLTVMNIMMMMVLLMVSSAAPRIIFQQQPDQENNLNSIFPRGLPSNQSTFCPDDLDWCDEPYHYPEHDILKAVAKQNKAVKIMFDRDDAPVPENKTTEISLRMFESEFENICDVDTTYIKPRAAKNKEGKFMFIVNHPEGADEYIQLVRVDTCISEGEECGQGRLASSVTTQCHQEYLDHKLVALSATGEELVVDTFSFPSCCTCLINTGLEL